MGLFHKKEEKIEINLSSGIVMENPLRMETSSWLKNCMVKSLLVFSIIFGSLGCFLSCYDVEYLVIPSAIILFAMALFFTSIYYRGWVMDLAYIIFFVIFVFLIRTFQIYINSGFYIIINTILSGVEDYFELPGMQYYEIQADNDILSTTLVVIFVGTVAMIVANVIISRTMNVWFMVVMTAWVWVFPMYFRLEPDALYVVLMIAGYLSMWAVRSSGAYGMDRKHRDYKWKDKYEKKRKAILKKNDMSAEQKHEAIHELEKKGKGLSFLYVQDAATVLETFGIMMIATILIYGLIAVVEDKDTFSLKFKQNPYKEETEQEIQEMTTRGTSIFNRYASTGGMSDGRLGGVNSVNPDYQTDLLVTFAPYTYEPMYLKGFTGINYVSSESMWTRTIAKESMTSREQFLYNQRMEGIDAVDAGQYIRPSNSAENQAFYGVQDVLKDSYEMVSGEQNGRAIMLIQNLGANPNYSYVPYYTTAGYSNEITQGTDLNGIQISGARTTRGNDTIGYDELGDILYPVSNFDTGTIAEYEYYPLLEESVLMVPESQIMTGNDMAKRIYMDVPEECLDAIAKACEEAGITSGDTEEEVVRKVQSYLETEFNYTTRPGRTPRGEDFISHFLDKKKGYCAHFASAATLMLRYSGVPARYIEGYVITFDDIAVSDLNEDYQYESFYEGYNPLGETAVIDVEVTDARAHAWVEYYDEYLGWRQLEVTTAAVDPEEDTGDSFWDIFSEEAISERDNNFGNGLNINPVDLNLDNLQGVWVTILVVLGILLLVLLMRKIYRSYKEYKTWHTEDVQENVLAYYHLISERLRSKDERYRECPTYRAQLMFMEKHCADWGWGADQMAELLEKAGYSKNGISEFDCKRLMIELADIDKKIRKWKKNGK